MPLDKAMLREYAEQWRDTATSAQREKLFKEHGVCYSELWQLPYWDPSSQLVIDSLHCILEGLVQHHVQSLLGLTTEKLKSSTASASTPAFHYDFQKIDSETAAALSMLTKEIVQVSSIHALLVAQAPSDQDTTCIATYIEKLTDSLLRRNMRPLRFVCQSLHCVPIHLEKKNWPLATCITK
jgi:hypothetical protein